MKQRFWPTCPINKPSSNSTFISDCLLLLTSYREEVIWCENEYSEVEIRESRNEGLDGRAREPENALVPDGDLRLALKVLLHSICDFKSLNG
jgi:hypothetical protein